MLEHGMRSAHVALLSLLSAVLSACSVSVSAFSIERDDGAAYRVDTHTDNAPPPDDVATDSASDAAQNDVAPMPPEGTACEYAFFKNYFDRDNGSTYAAMGDA